MLGRVKTSFDIAGLSLLDVDSINGYLKNISSLYDVIKQCSANGDYLMFKSKFGRNELCYLQDIRFDYVHGRVFAPVYIYNYKKVEDEDLSEFNKAKKEYKGVLNEILYDQQVELFEIWNSKQGYVIDSLTIVHESFFNIKLYKLELDGLPLRDDIVEESAECLIMKYIASIVHSYELEDEEPYISTKFSKLSKVEKRLLEKYKLNWIGDSDVGKFQYRDVRVYTFVELQDRFTNEELRLNESFQSRVIDFESYLLCHLHEKVYWEDFTLWGIRKKGYFFEKYKHRGISIIVKDYWLNSYR